VDLYRPAGAAPTPDASLGLELAESTILGTGINPPQGTGAEIVNVKPTHVAVSGKRCRMGLAVRGYGATADTKISGKVDDKSRVRLYKVFDPQGRNPPDQVRLREWSENGFKFHYFHHFARMSLTKVGMGSLIAEDTLFGSFLANRAPLHYLASSQIVPAALVRPHKGGHVEVELLSQLTTVYRRCVYACFRAVTRNSPLTCQFLTAASTCPHAPGVWSRRKIPLTLDDTFKHSRPATKCQD